MHFANPEADLVDAIVTCFFCVFFFFNICNLSAPYLSASLWQSTNLLHVIDQNCGCSCSKRL